MRRIYLDWNATTPPHPDVRRAMAAAPWGNPASSHATGREAMAVVEDCTKAAERLSGLPHCILTSGGTEADNLALLGFFPPGEPGALVTSRIEHSAILRAADELARRGVEVVLVDPDANGVVSPEAIRAGIASAKQPVRLVSLMTANHETGVIQPIPEVAAVAHAASAALHTDASQAAGKVPPSAWAGADMVTLSAHKIRGPKGIGALCTRGIELRPMLYGGGQQGGQRPGTQDPALCAGFAAAIRRVSPERYAELAKLRDWFEEYLIAFAAERGCEVVTNGGGRRLPHVMNLSWVGLCGRRLCAAFDALGIDVSTGSACGSKDPHPSQVIESMAGPERAGCAMRISLGEETTPKDVAEAVRRLDRLVEVY